LARLAGDPERARREAEGARHLSAARAVLARLALSAGDPEGALALTEPLDASAAAPRLLETRALAELALGRLEEAHGTILRALALAKRSGSPALEARALATEGIVLAALGRLETAASRYARAFELADRAGERHAAASALVNVGLGHLDRGDAGPAIDALREGARRLTALARRGDATRALYNLGNA